MNKTLQLTLSPTQQIVSVNDEPNPFKAEVTVSSVSGEPFDMLITETDNFENFGDNMTGDFQRASEGILQASVSNIDKFWHIILKSETDNVVNIQISQVESFDSAGEPAAKPRTNWGFILLIIIGVILFGVFLFTKLLQRRVPAASAAVEINNEPLLDADFLRQIDGLPEL
jgi:hypothetical protein